MTLQHINEEIKCENCLTRLDVNNIEHDIDCNGGLDANFWGKWKFMLPGGNLSICINTEPWTEDAVFKNTSIERSVHISQLKDVLHGKNKIPELDSRNYVYIIQQFLSGKENIHLYIGHYGPDLEMDPNIFYLRPSEDIYRYLCARGVECNPRGQWIINARCIFPKLSRNLYIGLDENGVSIKSMNGWKDKAMINLVNWLRNGQNSQNELTRNVAACVSAIFTINPGCVTMKTTKLWNKKSKFASFLKKLKF